MLGKLAEERPVLRVQAVIRDVARHEDRVDHGKPVDHRSEPIEKHVAEVNVKVTEVRDNSHSSRLDPRDFGP